MLPSGKPQSFAGNKVPKRSSKQNRGKKKKVLQPVEFKTDKAVRGFPHCFGCLKTLTIVQGPEGRSVVCPKGVLKGLPKGTRMLVHSTVATNCDSRSPEQYTTG